MWSASVLYFLVGLTFSVANPGWSDNTEYTYNVRGRTLTSLHEVSHQYSGIFFKALLRVQSESHGRLQAQLFEPQYTQIHSHLKDGWDTEVPDVELSWKPLPMSSKAFQIGIKDGFINDVIVSQETPIWEANIIKSIVSQFQLDTNGGRSDRYDKENSAVFITMEDTVTGNTETFYEVHPLPNYIVQNLENGDQLLERKGDRQIYEVIKHKNYSNNIELPSYFYGFGGLEIGLPATNKMGYFFLRNSIGRALLTGNMKRYTIQKSSTVNEIIVNPTLTSRQRGGVFSKMSVTLEGMKSAEQTIQDVLKPVHLGNLVYIYGNPSSLTNYVHDYRDPVESRQQRSAKILYGNQESEEDYKNEQPELEEAPNSPLLPYTMGYNGMSIKRRVDIVKSVVQLAQEIGSDLQDAEEILQKDTLNKFTILSALLRVMDLHEIKRATNQLYTESEDGSKRDSWNAFRDSVAESDTGPALLAIQNWIQSEKITRAEACHVITTMSNTARHPTFQFMKTFFDIVKSSKVQSEWPLNDTALLSYSKFTRRVYVAGKESKQQYPSINVDVERGVSFLKHGVVRYYSQELDHAISKGKTHRIHVLIRSLGNIGHPFILPAFEPYLEGKKQASQYQRLLMVVAMDKLAEYYKNEARSVLLRIYQNTGEYQEVRVAAVYQLMRTHPDAETLQLMAAYTNIDKHEHVNAAVKSSIESAAELETENPKLIALCTAAKQAKPLLTTKTYSIQYGVNYLQSRFIEEMGFTYKESIQIIGSPDHYVSKGLKYSLRKYFGGINQRVFHLQLMVSSIKEFVHVFKKQTEYYSTQQQQQKSSYNLQKQYQWSCQNIASLLNIQSEELEQLEGSLYVEYGHIDGMISFDNMTMERFPGEIRNIEDEYRNGKKVAIVKMFNEKEMALSLPTETGFPFVFTYDAPTVVNIKGLLKATADPRISQNNKIHVPDSIQIKSDLNVLLTRKVQSRISFVTPFDHQQYIAGFDKQRQINIPIQGSYNFDVKKMQMRLELEPVINQRTLLYHYSSQPYTARIDLTKFKPAINQPNTQTLQQEPLQSYDTIWGKKETGLAFHVQVQHKQPFFNYFQLKKQFIDNSPVPAILDFWEDTEVQHSQVKVSVLPEQSTTNKIVISVGYQQEYRVTGPLYERKFTVADDPMRRQHQQNLLERVSSGIKNVNIDAVDAEIDFRGQKCIKYAFTAALAHSTVDPKSRLLLNYKKSSDDQNVEPYEASLDVQNEIPNSDTLDLEYAMQNEPKAQTRIKVMFGASDDPSASKIEAQIKFGRSEKRKQYLMRQPMYQQCVVEMSNGDRQLPACVNQTIEANLLDIIDAESEYQNLDFKVKSTMKTLYHAWLFQYFPLVGVDNQEKTPSDQIRVQVYFDPDFKTTNISVKTPEEQTEITNINAKEFLVFHPEFSLPSSLSGRILKGPYYRTFCVVDKTRISTFNNNTFPAYISKYWTVMFQYVPKRARHMEHQLALEGQMKHQIEHYAVLVRESPEDNRRKEVKITLSSPKTQYKVPDITMVPQQDNSEFKAKVTINGKTVELSQKKSYVYQNSYIEIYGLPNGEVKFEVEDGFHVIYDGTRAKLSVDQGKFKDAVRGICGQNNDQKNEDLYTPVDCITSNSHKFIKSYEIEGTEGLQVRQEFTQGNEECLERKVPLYVNVVTHDGPAGSNPWIKPSGSFSGCTSYQTRYVEQNTDICFTLQAMPVCQSGCQAQQVITKDVPVHCIQKSNVAQLWKDQIDKGGNPDFSHKTETKKISLELPQECFFNDFM